MPHYQHNAELQNVEKLKSLAAVTFLNIDFMLKDPVTVLAD